MAAARFSVFGSTWCQPVSTMVECGTAWTKNASDLSARPAPPTSPLASAQHTASPGERQAIGGRVRFGLGKIRRASATDGPAWSRGGM